jgi:hypothetical protein
MQFFNRQTRFVKLLSLALLAVILVGTGILAQDRILKARAAVQVLLVSHTAIPFGTVFPGEMVSETYTVQLDNSVGAATYFSHLEIVPDKLDLCPFLVITPIDQPAEGDTFATSTLVAIVDGIDSWQVKLAVPAIEGHVAQDHDGDIIVDSGDYACKIVIITPTPEGCTPGYWKQSQHFDQWTSPYDPPDPFSSVFENAFPGKSLLQVLNLGGGGLNALGRHTVAALLSAANSDVDYAFTTAQVVSMFNAAYPGNNAAYENLKNIFAQENERGCPLN